MRSDKPQQQKEHKPRPPKKITQSYLTNSGLGYLQRFSASSGHFKIIMRRKIQKSCAFHIDQNEQDCLDILDTVTQKFQDMGYINDDAYAGALVYSYAMKGLSFRRIEQKMRMKSLSSDTVKQAITHYKDQQNNTGIDFEKIAALRMTKRKRLGHFRRPEKEENKNKELAALARAGFSFETANFALSTSKKEAEHYLSLS